MKTLRNGFAGLALAAVALAAPATAQELVKVGSFVPEQSVGVARVIKPWMEAVAADTDEVRMQGFWGGTLGKSPFKQFELVQNGVADVTWVLPGYTAGQFPEMGLFELPFLFETADEASVVGFFAAEPNALFMKTKIDDLGDLENMKIRSAGGIAGQWLDSLGAAPQTLSSAEMNEALNRGTVDGGVQGWTGMQTFKSLPLVDQAYNVPAGTIPFLLLMNEAKWNALSPAAQEAVMAHGGLAMAEMGGGAYTEIGESIRDDVRAEGRIEIIEPTDAELAPYAEAAKAVHEAWIAETPNGQAVYDAAVKLLEEMRGGAAG
jgi:TRAP-type C4-dicarboxylate transport system substrate-binding protein